MIYENGSTLQRPGALVLLTKLRRCAVALLRVALRCSEAARRGRDQECVERRWRLRRGPSACSQRRSVAACSDTQHICLIPSVATSEHTLCAITPTSSIPSTCTVPLPTNLSLFSPPQLNAFPVKLRKARLGGGGLGLTS